MAKIIKLYIHPKPHFVAAQIDTGVFLLRLSEDANAQLADMEGYDPQDIGSPEVTFNAPVIFIDDTLNYFHGELYGFPGYGTELHDEIPF